MPGCDLQQKKAVMFRKTAKYPLEVDRVVILNLSRPQPTFVII